MCTAACVPSRGAATAQCSACAAFLVAAAAGAAKRVQEGLSLLLYSFVSSFQVVLCEQRCACGQVANPLGSLALARFGRGYRQIENETNVRHSVRSETPKVRHSCGGASYVTFYPRLVKNWGAASGLPPSRQASHRKGWLFGLYVRRFLSFHRRNSISTSTYLHYS